MGSAGLVIVAAVSAVLFSARGQTITLARTDVMDDIFATGNVVSAGTIDFGFPFDGRVAKIYVKEGQAVKEGDALARLDTAELEGETAKLQAQINVAKLQLAQLLSGVASKELAVLSSKEDEARIALNNAEKASEDQKLMADNKFVEEYASVVAYGDTVLLNADSAINGLEEIYEEKNQFRYIFLVPESLARSDAQWQMGLVRTALGNITSDVQKLKANPAPAYDDMNMIVSRFKTNLEVIRSLLQKTSDILDTAQIAFGAPDIGGYRTTMAVQRAVINATQTALIGFEQEIASEKTNRQVAADEAERNIAQLEASLQTAQREFALKQSESGGTEIALAQAQIKAYEASISVLNDKIARATISAPVAGTVTGIETGEGKMGKIGGPAVSMLPVSHIQIEIDPKTLSVLPKLGDLSTVSLTNGLMVAGSVGSVSNAKVIVYVMDDKETLQSSESVLVRIRATIAQSALMVPKEFIFEQDGVTKVMVLKGGSRNAALILTGINWKDSVEVLEGVSEGDRIVKP